MSDLTERQVRSDGAATATISGMDGMGPEFAARLEKKIWVRIWLANLVGVVPISVFLVLGWDFIEARFAFPAWMGPVSIVAVYMPAYFWSKREAHRTFQPIAAWIVANRQPDAGEREYTIDHPRRLTLISLKCWIYAAVVMAVGIAIVFEPLGVHYIRLIVIDGAAITVACMLCFLVAEDAMRPLFAAVMTPEVAKPRGAGVLARLLSIWVIGTASYFVTVGMIVGWAPEDRLGAYVVLGCAFGLAVSLTLQLNGARSVSRPLEGLRHAIARVEKGDLEASVDVDDTGEVGQLQSGFNRMVGGLRERDRLQQLFSRHVGDEVAQRAVAAATFGGTQLDVSVMFVDVIGSTTLAAERPPEAVVAMLNSLFAEVVLVVGEHGGLVNQFQGDGALCVFGAPVEMSDHAERALRATTALRAKIESLGNAYPGFDAAIGVSSGRVVAGDVGTENRSEYTVIGDAANEASRLVDEAKNREGRVLVSATTIISAGDAAGGWLACDELSLRGRRQPTLVYEPEAL